MLVLTALLGTPVAADTGGPARQDAPPAASDAPAMTFSYRAFVAGTPVGRATVTVDISGDRYRVQGDASSNGWLQGFTRWRNRFSAHGRIQDGERQPAEFHYTETDRDKKRHVVVRDGTLRVTKNGHRRPARRSPGGADVVSALFVDPSCAEDHQLHTGRHVYRLSRLEHRADGCRYQVLDDDDDRFEIDLVLARRGQLIVPEKITVHGWVTGWVTLVDDGGNAGLDDEAR